MDRYSARTGPIQNKETATHETNTELTCVRGCEVTKNQKCELTTVETAKDRVDHKPRTKTIWQLSV